MSNPKTGGPKGTKTYESYRQAAKYMRKRMADESPLDAEALAAMEASDILVVPGQYDQVELVLSALELPHTSVSAARLPECQLSPKQTLVINCPGNIPERSVRQIRSFVEHGGTLFTTDWALKQVLERAFPGYVEFNQRPTADDVVKIEVLDRDVTFLEGVLENEDEPVWWLEGSSYPIRVLNKDHVTVLVTSRELEAKYGEPAVAITFSFGEGEVFHMISHYYLQRTELRSTRHKSAAASYLAAKGVGVDADWAAELVDLKGGELEAAYSSARLFANVVAAKKRKAKAAKKTRQPSSRNGG